MKRTRDHLCSADYFSGSGTHRESEKTSYGPSSLEDAYAHKMQVILKVLSFSEVSLGRPVSLSGCRLKLITCEVWLDPALEAQSPLRSRGPSSEDWKLPCPSADDTCLRKSSWPCHPPTFRICIHGLRSQAPGGHSGWSGLHVSTCPVAAGLGEQQASPPRPGLNPAMGAQGSHREREGMVLRPESRLCLFSNSQLQCYFLCQISLPH